MSHLVARNTFYLTLAFVGQKAIAFFYYIFLARMMMPEKTGTYFLALSIMIIISVIADFGTTSVLIREGAKDKSQIKVFIQKSLSFKMPLVIFGFIITLLVAWLLPYDPLTRFLIAVSSFILVLDSFSLFFYGVLRAYQLLRYESMGMLFGQFLTATLGVCILFFYPSLIFLVFALLLGSSFNLIFSALQVVGRLGKEILIPLYDRVFIKRLIWMAFPFALSAIFVKVYSYTDSILISFFLGKEEVGIYSIAYKFTYAFQFLPLAFIASLYPEMSRLVDKHQGSLLRLLDRSFWYMMLLASPLCFGIWSIASDAIELTGDAYLQAVPVLQSLIFVLIPIFLDFPIGSLLNAAGRQSLKTSIMGVTMLINVFFNILFIPIFGILGASYAALISFFFMFLAGLISVRKIFPDFSWWHFLRMIIPIFLSGWVMGLIVFEIRPIIGFIPSVISGFFIYFILLILTGSFNWKHLFSLMGFFKPYAKNTSLDA
ncbi:hypothetical protein CO172_00670 [Candidatus Uhrbacteria bacterium CG_4_9_14_3_um_filter_36_7]|uniref:Uncharacterized protein n=1 Tax=Candidatus Uhrbacteria bacterium CG_4_9_14_3_um_filter_36_7 TaxID=1975033 RepID=A0A2M7XI88_9BACT|nr:MAG: hypothetical protein CO172_00670 [Candidatus Uhrbacteria bacterium CG_4_9_14_3_um_filter_36_7]